MHAHGMGNTCVGYIDLPATVVEKARAVDKSHPKRIDAFDARNESGRLVCVADAHHLDRLGRDAYDLLLEITADKTRHRSADPVHLTAGNPIRGGAFPRARVPDQD